MSDTCNNLLIGEHNKTHEHIYIKLFNVAHWNTVGLVWDTEPLRTGAILCLLDVDVFNRTSKSNTVQMCRSQLDLESIFELLDCLFDEFWVFAEQFVPLSKQQVLVSQGDMVKIMVSGEFAETSYYPSH